MDFLETLTQRNGDFARDSHVADLKMLPSTKTIIIGCVDPRVDPVDIFKLEAGEALVIRNVAGRISEDTLETLKILAAVARSAGKEIGAGWNLIVLHHTDCGIIGGYRAVPDLLAKHLDVTPEDLEHMHVTDPYAAVKADVAALKANTDLPGDVMVSGLVYTVATGLVDTVVPAVLLRP